MRILFFTDTHVRSYSPVNRKDNFQESLFEKLEEIVRISRNEKVDLVLHGGDLFDVYDVSNRLLGRTAELFRQFPAPVYVVPGNHDTVGYSLSSIPNTSLGVLARSGVVKLLIQTEQMGGVVLYPIASSADIPASSYILDRQFGDVHIIISHDNLVPAPIHKDIPHKVLSEDLSNADIVFAGHWHPGWPRPLKLGCTVYANPGSIARIDAGPGSKDRLVQVAIADITRSGVLDVRYIPLKSAKPYAEVFVDTKQEKGVDLSNIGASIESGSDAPIIDVFSMLLEQDIPESTMSIIKSKVDNLLELANSHVQYSKDPVWIAEVNISNFQSHEDTFIKLSPGLNVIVGPSDSGKSAVLRALWWLFYNKPKGADFIKLGKKDVKVSAKFSNGVSIERSRTKSSSGYYSVAYDDGEAVEFKGIGNTVPPEVIAAHKMPLIELTGEEVSVNVARQFDLPFVLGFPNSMSIALLDVITRNDAVFKIIKDLRSDEDTMKKRIESLKLDLGRTNEALALLNLIVALKRPLQSIVERYSEVSTIFSRLKEMSDLAKRWEKLSKSLAGIEQLAEGLGAKLEAVNSKIKEAETIVEDYKVNYDQFIRAYNYKASVVLRNISNLSTAHFEKAYNNYVSLLSSVDICPLCGSSMDSSHLCEEIKNSYEAIIADANRLTEEGKRMKNGINTLNDDIVMQIRNARTSFETARANVAATLKLVETGLSELKLLEAECESKFGVRPAELDNLINNLAQTLSAKLQAISQDMSHLKQEYMELSSKLKDMGVF